jgi:hypothetical protein
MENDQQSRLNLLKFDKASNDFGALLTEGEREDSEYSVNTTDD